MTENEERMQSGGGDPFEGLAVSERWKDLLNTDGRSTCPNCKKSRKYFCYTCFLPMDSIHDVTPKVTLPIEVDVIKHPREIDGKSTAIHAAVLAPQQVTVYTFPAIPDYSEIKNKVVLVFPGKNAKPLNEVVADLSIESAEPGSEDFTLKRVVFIDSTWNQCRTILNDPRIKGLPCVVLEKRATHFWRYQKGSPRTHLSTIEAIHQFLIEYHSNVFPCKPYQQEYDNILFFFVFMYHKIHTLYNHEDLLSYKRSAEL